MIITQEEEEEEEDKDTEETKVEARFKDDEGRGLGRRTDTISCLGSRNVETELDVSTVRLESPVKFGL